jgi:hypothetical protein
MLLPQEKTRKLHPETRGSKQGETMVASSVFIMRRMLNTDGFQIQLVLINTMA